MQKTLGGDRLGSGKRMKVELRNFERSTHDLGYLWRSTMAAGTLVPFMKELALPGDTFDINLGCDIKTHPTVGPLFGSYKVQLDVFQCPIRLYQGELHNNKLGIGLNMANVKLPQMELNASIFDAEDVPDLDNAQINPSCIFSYLGIRGVGMNTGTFPTNVRQFNAVPYLAYWDIYKNYYANKQEEVGAYLHTIITPLGTPPTQVGAKYTFSSSPIYVPEQGTGTAISNVTLGGMMMLTHSGTAPIYENIMLNLTDGRRLSWKELTIGEIIDFGGTVSADFDYNKWGEIAFNSWQMRQDYEITAQPPTVTSFNLSEIDDMREYLLTNLSTSPVIINNAFLAPYSPPMQATGTYNHMLSSQEGLALKTYQSDLLNNWLQTDWIDGVNGINAVTAVDTTSGEFKIDTLILARKVYEMLNQIAVSGGTYDDWMDAVWNHDRYQRCETPMYMGGLIKELVFQEVVSNSESANATQPLGTLAGKGIMAGKHKGGTVVIKVDEPSYIIGIISLTPRLDYSQGNKWDTTLQTMDDLHKPWLDQIGFQESINEQRAWWSTHRNPSTGDWDLTSAGKVPAWINYMTNVNETRGNFAIQSNEMFMTLNRRYTPQLTAIPNIQDLTTYIDPAKFNNIFALQSRDSQNFWAQISVDITARRKMSAKVMPNL